MLRKVFYKTLNAYKNTSANEYISQIKKEKMIATMRGYDSVIDFLLDKQDGNRELYDRQILLLWWILHLISVVILTSCT